MTRWRASHARTTWVYPRACSVTRHNIYKRVSGNSAVFVSNAKALIMAGQQRTLSFSVERILRQPYGNGVVSSRCPDGHGISLQQASLPASLRSHHPMYAYSFLAATPLMAELLQQRAAMIAASPAFWSPRSYCAPSVFENSAALLDGGGATAYEREGVQLQRKHSCK